MKISNGTEFRFGTPKYSRIWSPLLSVGFALIFIFHFVYPKSPDWLSDIGFLLLVAGLIVSLVGTVAERREWEAKHKSEKK
jgi:protein-S-isoprenylcysteine O-methyltransferase Ste14